MLSIDVYDDDESAKADAIIGSYGATHA